MAKAYMVVTYRSISDPDALAAYAKIAGPAIQAAGGKFLVRGTPAKTYEMGIKERTVVVEFDSVAGDRSVRRSRLQEGARCPGKERGRARHAHCRGRGLIGLRPRFHAVRRR